jgi:hypothetical protein
MATIGDPLMDLAERSLLGEPGRPPPMHAIRMVPTHLEGCSPVTSWSAGMRNRWGRLSRTLISTTASAFSAWRDRQQIYWRFYHGQTKDERFKWMIVAIQVLEQRARQVIGCSDL